MSDIKDKAILITGASSGIGEATARVLARKGARVVLGARRTDRLESLAKQIRDEGGVAHFRNQYGRPSADFANRTTLARPPAVHNPVLASGNMIQGAFGDPWRLIDWTSSSAPVLYLRLIDL